MCIKKIYREVFCKSVFVSWKKKAGGGIGGRAQRLPPKQNDNTYSYKQSYMQKRSASPKAEWQYLFSQARLQAKHQYISLYLFT